MSRMPLMIAIAALFPLTAVAARTPPAPTAQHNVAVNADADELALHGYDAVAYFADGVPTRGDARFAATYDGARYQFSTDAHRQAFTADPARYAPQFGGFCALGTAYGEKVDTDPETGKVVDGKLYLNNSKKVAERWETDRSDYIAKADFAWLTIKDKAP
ncbi:YHS domain-containing (seleno)protein [Sphingomonas faeni]|uniref:YHS domain-containing (seleno)protein n=1 Tax=Sphingomonas faeni TaxID=185950 RepID=UPI0033556DFF